MIHEAFGGGHRFQALGTMQCSSGLLGFVESPSHRMILHICLLIYMSPQVKVQ